MKKIEVWKTKQFCIIRTLSKAKEENRVNNAKSKHVSNNHAVNHRHKRTSQFDGSERKKKCRFY